jgi:arylamine N-acetyltransferase
MQPLDEGSAERLLRLLGMRAGLAGFAGLTELVGAYSRRVPFENISKLLYKQRRGLTYIADIDLFLDGIERWNFGGTCYANNYYLCRLLLALGYHARLCGADMSTPDVHAAIVTELDGEEYLIDAGYAAPFAAPMRRGLREDFVIHCGRNQYVLNPQDTAGCSRLEHRRDGAAIHGYTLKPQARELEHFRGAIESSFCPDATFMNAVLVARFRPEGFVTLHNEKVLIERDGESEEYQLSGRNEMCVEIERLFGIPDEIAREATAKIATLKDEL